MNSYLATSNPLFGKIEVPENYSAEGHTHTHAMRDATRVSPLSIEHVCVCLELSSPGGGAVITPANRFLCEGECSTLDDVAMSLQLLQPLLQYMHLKLIIRATSTYITSTTSYYYVYCLHN